MSKKEVDAFNVRIDKIIEGLTEIKVETAGIREHLKTLNGKVATHEQRFTDVFNEFRVAQTGRSSCQDGFRKELENIRKDFAAGDKLQDETMSQIDKRLWETKIQLAGIAVVVPIIMSLIMWVLSKTV